MKNIRLVLCVIATAFAILQPSRAAVTFSIVPAVVSNTYSGYITLQIQGLTNTESVVVQKFLDLNNKGVIDGGDWLVQQFTLTDGQAGMVIGGVTNINVPGDTDGAADGKITAALNFQSGDFMQNICGTYLYRLSSPAGHFTPITIPFVVSNFAYAQKITGNVVSNNTSVKVPYAVVVVLQPPRAGNSGPGNPFAGVVANNVGGYTIQIPSGTYVLLALSSNYVYNFAASPVLSMATGQTINTNLTLIPATSSIAGKVVDANTGVGLPGLGIFAENSPNNNGIIAFTCADTNGNYNLPVTAGEWGLGPEPYQALGFQGYVGWYNDPIYRAGAGSTGVNLAYYKATALFYGSVKDSLGNPMPGIAVSANDSSDEYNMEGNTDINGNYVAGALGGVNNPWSVNVDDSSRPTNYLFSEQTVSGTDNLGQAALQNFTAILATNFITGSLKDNNGNPIAGIGIYDYDETPVNGLYYQGVSEVLTDTNGNFLFNVANGTWDVEVDYWGDSESLPTNYISPPDQYPVISNNNAMVNFTAPLFWTFAVHGGIIEYTTNNAGISIASFKYNGPGGAVTIPSTISGLPVTSIGKNAFYECGGLTSITIPATVTNIGEEAFQWCTSLGSVYFEGNAPSADSSVFQYDSAATAYYLPGTTGWGSFPTTTGIPAKDEYGYVTNASAITFTSYYGPGGAVFIPSTINGLPVTSIAGNAFYGHTSLTDITIPGTVTNIGPTAFGDCPSLTAIKVAAGNPVYSSIAGVLFNQSQTTLLEYPVGLAGNYTIPNSVTSIGTNAFEYCTGLTSITIPNSVTSIGNYVFNGCISLTSVVIPSSVTNIGEFAFYDCTSLTNITIPNSVTTIGASAFNECFSLTSITIPSSLNSIGSYAFANSGLTSVEFDGNAPNADTTVFQDVPMSIIYFLPGTTGWGSTFAGLRALLWDPPAQFGYLVTNGTISISSYFGSGTTVVVPSEIDGLPVTCIGEYAFEYSSITNITIPNSVTNIGDYAFYDCHNLASITIPNSVTSIGNYAFAADYYYATSPLTNITFGTNVNSIGANAFQYCTSLTSVTIPHGITSIGANTFSWCVSLTNIIIPNSVTNIGDYAFDFCDSLTSILIPSSINSIGEDPFQDCSSLTAITVAAGNLFYSSVGGVLFNQSKTTLVEYPGGLAGSYTIPTGVTDIETNAFLSCQNLTSITIPSSLSSIPVGAFEECTSLTNVSIPNSITNIGELAFFATGLTSVMIPNSVTSIGGEAFECCYSLASATIPNSVTSIGDFAFQQTGLTNVTIPNSITSIGNSEFAYCYDLANITIGTNVTSIGEYAFYDCTNLTGVFFQGNAPTTYVFDYSFYGVSNATVYYYPGSSGWGATYDGLPTVLASADSLQVTINPPSAVSAGAQWQVDNNGAWLNSGTTATNLSAGNHTVRFSAINGWISPAKQTVFISSNSLAITSGTYTVPATAQAQFTFTTNADGSLSITGYIGLPRAVTIPSMIGGLTVTSIGADAFYGNSITNITIPGSVTSIGDSAFNSCISLTSVTIPSSVISIGNYAFSGCGMTNVTISSSVTNIGVEAFTYCARLLAITVAAQNPDYNSVNGVLFDKSQSTLIQCPGGLRGSYSVPDGVANIGDEAFGNSSLTSILLSASVITIGDWAFEGCENLAGITIPNSVTSIGDYAFDSCGLMNVAIPRSVTSIGAGAFLQCASLSAITVAASNSYYSSIAGVLFDKNQTTLICYPGGLFGWYTIPTGVNSIGSEAFANSGLTSLTIPNSITSIGDWAFQDCQNLSAITIPSSVTFIGNYAFYGCGSLSTVFFEGNAPTVGSNAFIYAGNAQIYYLSGASGWGSEFAGLPAIMLSGLVQNGGFETDDFTDWALSGDTSYTFIDDGSESEIIPYSGNYEVALGTSGSFGYISQTLSTTPGKSYLLSLWLDSPDGQSPNEFLVSWNGNTLFDGTNLPATGWTNLHFLVSATKTNTVLEFGFRDDPSYLGLDDISVVAEQPSIASISLSGTNLVLTVSDAQSGHTYVTLMSTNLTLPFSQWTPLTTNLLNTGGNVTITNTLNRNTRQCYYILKQQ